MPECPGDESILHTCCRRCPHYFVNVDFRAKMVEENGPEDDEKEEENA